ncbi:TetR-like C-terminal domain-containing protein [Streptacidiphilus sp. PAMC 29251]
MHVIHRPWTASTGVGRPGATLRAWASMLHGYRIEPTQEIHALRMLRTVLHGFASLEVVGGFQFSTDIDDSFTWMIAFLDRGLQAITATNANSAAADGDC